MKLFHSILTALTLGLVSCGSTATREEAPVTPTSSSIPTIENLANKIDEQTTNIRSEATAIKTNGTQVEATLWDVQASVTDPEKKDNLTDAIVMINKINDSADYIAEQSNQVDKDLMVLDEVADNIQHLELRAAELQQAQEAARQESLKRLYAFISTFWIIGFIVIVGGIAVGFFVNKKMGFTIAIVGAIMVGFAAASQFYLKEIAQFGAFLLIGMIVFGMVIIVRSMIQAHKSSTAVKEIVDMIEILKETMTEDEKNRIFGPDGVASKVQSDLTKEVIAKIKADDGHPPTFPTGTTGA